MQRITTFFTFKDHGAEAVKFYRSIFKNSFVHHMVADPDHGRLLHAAFSLDGQEFMAMDGGDDFIIEQGISLFVTCKDQAEVDYYWQQLGEGGSYLQCGWLKDKFGVSWQVVPKQLGELLNSSDPKKSHAVFQAMLEMQKIDIAGLQQAHDQA